MKIRNKSRIKIICVVGARPNFIKVAPLFEKFKKHRAIKPVLVHTGQHYDFRMSKIFFRDLNIPKPNYNLGVGSGSHAWQTAKMMEKIEPLFLKEKPNLIIVVGDVNSTLAGALTAAKLHIPVAHIEAGLRSYDKTMPEEINRRLTDHLSDYLFVTEQSGVENLINEGISRNKIYLVGDIMIDTLLNSKSKIENSDILKKLGLKKKDYSVLTLHRPSNVDEPEKLNKFFDILTKIQKKMKIIFPIHPRTEKALRRLKIDYRKLPNLKIIKPLGYIDFIALISGAKFVLTDSGCIQAETTFLNTPCLTFRRNTERPVTIEVGTNMICKTGKRLDREINQVLNGKYKKGQIPKFWDGETVKRILMIFKKILCRLEIKQF